MLAASDIFFFWPDGWAYYRFQLCGNKEIVSGRGSMEGRSWRSYSVSVFHVGYRMIESVTIDTTHGSPKGRHDVIARWKLPIVQATECTWVEIHGAELVKVEVLKFVLICHRMIRYLHRMYRDRTMLLLLPLVSRGLSRDDVTQIAHRQRNGEICSIKQLGS
jgi:hypothetical protein